MVNRSGIGRYLKNAILIFWLIMTVLFLKQEIFPAFFTKELRGYRKIIPRDLLLKDSWYGIYFKSSKIGYSHTQIVAAEKKMNASYTISTQALVTLSILGKSQLVWLEGEVNLGETYLLEDFSFLLRMGNQKFAVKGKSISENRLFIETDISANKVKQELSVPSDIVVSALFSPFNNILSNLKQRERFMVNSFNPLTGKIETSKVRVLSKEKLSFSGVLLDALVIESESQGFKTLSWIDAESGDILKQETPLGWMLVKEPQLEAMNFVRRKVSKNEDLAVVFSVKTNLTLPPKVEYLKLRIKNLDASFSLIQDKRQRVLSRDLQGAVLELFPASFKKEEALSLPLDRGRFAPFLESTLFVPSADQEIKDYARKIVGGEKNSLAAVESITGWMDENIRKTVVLSLPNAKEVLRTKIGDCNEYTYLFAALARAAGIPTKIISGLVYLEGRFFYHMWPQVYLGKWLAIDPVLNQKAAGATHIALVEGELVRQLELAKVLGKIEVEVLEYR